MTPATTPATTLATTTAADRDRKYRLEVAHLTKRYRGQAVVDDLTISVEPGRVTGFLGPNGSGKSTTMKMLLGLAAANGAPAVRTVAEGGALLAPSITRRLIGRFATTLAADTAVARRLGSLTDRERDVLVELATGATNAEIAERLVIGAATVKTHVSSILTKAGLRDRAQAVVFAYESGLVTPGGLDIGY